MPVRLNQAEKKLAKMLAKIKKKAGSHSPSPAMLREVSGINLQHDFCFLANPHATDLFLKYWKRGVGNGENLRKLVELYPSQNRVLAEKLERLAGVSARHIFVGNGATEVIQAVLHNFAKKKILVPVPTFSPYLEFVPKRARPLRHELRKNEQFKLNLKRLFSDIRGKKPDTVVIINPNNPDGGYITSAALRALLKTLRHMETVIVDESFVHFAGRKIESADRLVAEYPNLIVIKSLSKDFGIAGLRLGYGVMSEKRVSALLANGYLWNVSGFGEYFLNLLNREDFLRQYEQARRKAMEERDELFCELQKIQGIRVYPSKANMFLIELLDGTKARDLMVRLLVRHGIYVRTCYDKVGLNGEFIRVASRKRPENGMLIAAITGAFAR